MTLLRIALLALAVLIFVTLGWRLAETPEHARTVATASGTSAPQPVPAPADPNVAPPANPASPAAPTAGSHESGELGPSTSGLAASDARRAIEARLQTGPDLARVFDAVKANFPAVAERNLAAAVAAAQSTGAMPSPDDFIAATMRDLRLTSGVLAARAGPDALEAIFDAKAATLADLEAADPRICADYLFGSTSPEFNDFVVAHRALVARTALATIAAMTDGRTRQMSWDTPSHEDYGLIEKGLAEKGLSTAEVAALLDGKSLDPQPSDTRLCDNMRAYLDVMRSMPAEARDRVYGLAAELLARS